VVLANDSGRAGTTKATPTNTTNLSVRLATGYSPASATELNDVAAYLVRRNTAIQSLLAAQSVAVLKRDQTAFLRSTDHTNAAFIRHQRELFANLVQLDFGAWSYHAETDSAYGQQAIKWQRYRADDVVVMPVTLLYRLRGFDAGSVAREKDFTFVRRGSTWTLASDSDVSAVFTTNTVTDPWDVGQIAVARGSRSLVIGSRSDRKLLRSIAALEDKAISKVGRHWTRKWSHRVVLVVPRDKRLITALFRGSPITLTHVGAVAIPLYASDASDTARPVGARVVVNPAYFAGATDLELLTHETTHVATLDATDAGEPTWLVEGYAEYVARPPDVLTTDFLRLARSGHLPTLLPNDSDWIGQQYGSVLYDQSWLACKFIADKWGERKLVELYTRLGAITTSNEGLLAQDGTLRSVLGLSEVSFTKKWISYMRSFVNSSSWRPLRG
jgi:hypothetical protein